MKREATCLKCGKFVSECDCKTLESLKIAKLPKGIEKKLEIPSLPIQE